MKENRKKQENGICIHTLSLLFCGIIGVFAVGSVILNLMLNRNYHELDQNMENYSYSWEAAALMQSFSDELTMMAQHFVVTGEAEYLEQYFTRRDSATRSIAYHRIKEASEEYGYLEIEKQLNEMEYHAMKLAAVAYDVEDAVSHCEILDYQLSDTELAMIPEEQKEAAIDLIFGADYAALKENVEDNVERYTDVVLEQQEDKNAVSLRYINYHIWFQWAMLLMLGVSITILAVVVYNQVIRILRDYLYSIAGNHRLKETGVYELRVLARAHNNNLEQAKERQRGLQSKADHDLLTGLANRGGFRELFEKWVRTQGSKGAFLILDVDEFKEINDTYGHETGDLALQYVADVLKNSFRAVDLIGRYGGDEFLVWMGGITESQADYVAERVRNINAGLSQPKDGIPLLSVSVGIVISSSKTEYTDIFSKADKALYYVKENGRRGGCIYGRDEVIR